MLRSRFVARQIGVENHCKSSIGNRNVQRTWGHFLDFSALKLKLFPSLEVSELQKSNKEEFVSQIYGTKLNRAARRSIFIIHD